MPQRRIPFSAAELKTGIGHLRKDRWLGKIISTTEHPAPGARKDPFHALVVGIANQQISVTAARAIVGRLGDLLGTPFSPGPIVAARRDRLRAAGLSNSKVDSMKACAKHALKHGLTVKSCKGMSDGEIVESLCGIKGVGPWTAHMVLVFGLGRPDVMPDGDGGIIRAASNLFGIEDRVRARERLVRVSPGWAPHRTIAAWFLWRSLYDD